MSAIEQLTYSAENDGATVHVDIIDLIHELAGSCDVPYVGYGHWLNDVMITKLADSNMSNIIDIVLDEGLTVPLNVRDEYGEAFTMGNGHHRLIAALLCGVKSLDVYVTTYTDFSKSTKSGNGWDDEDRIAEAYHYKAILQDIRCEVLSIVGD